MNGVCGVCRLDLVHFEQLAPNVVNLLALVHRGELLERAWGRVRCFQAAAWAQRTHRFGTCAKEHVPLQSRLFLEENSLCSCLIQFGGPLA